MNDKEKQELENEFSIRIQEYLDKAGRVSLTAVTSIPVENIAWRMFLADKGIT